MSLGPFQAGLPPVCFHHLAHFPGGEPAGQGWGGDAGPGSHGQLSFPGVCTLSHLTSPRGAERPCKKLSSPSEDKPAKAKAQPHTPELNRGRCAEMGRSTRPRSGCRRGSGGNRGLASCRGGRTWGAGSGPAWGAAHVPRPPSRVKLHFLTSRRSGTLSVLRLSCIYNLTSLTHQHAVWTTPSVV